MQNFKIQKKKKGHFILCFVCIFFLFIFVCNIQKKKKGRKLAETNEEKKKIKFRNSKVQKKNFEF